MQPTPPEAANPPNRGPEKPACPCGTDPYASLPAGLKPPPRSVMDDLLKVTCRGCGQVFWTNRKTEWCAQCAPKNPGPAAE